MFFRRKSWLRNEFDEKLINHLNMYKDDWQRQKLLLERSFDPSAEVICETKLSELKYFFLLREAKYRDIKITKY